MLTNNSISNDRIFISIKMIKDAFPYASEIETGFLFNKFNMMASFENTKHLVVPHLKRLAERNKGVSK